MASSTGGGSILSEGHREWCPDESGGAAPGGTHCDARGRGAGPRYGTARLHGLRQSGFAVSESMKPPRERVPRQVAGILRQAAGILRQLPPLPTQI